MEMAHNLQCYQFQHRLIESYRYIYFLLLILIFDVVLGAYHCHHKEKAQAPLLWQYSDDYFQIQGVSFT